MMSDKRGTPWIQNLNKREVIVEIEKRGLQADEQAKLDELRKVLREECKREEKEAKEETKYKMEYTAKLDFRLEKDEWEEFVERIELYFEANEIIDEEKKRAILLTKIDADTYRVVRKVCAPKKPKETDLEEIKTKMENYLKPKVSETVLRQRFRERKQKKDESVIKYITSLKNLARDCKFKEENDALLDQFITVIRNKNIKIALFKKE